MLGAPLRQLPPPDRAACLFVFFVLRSAPPTRTSNWPCPVGFSGAAGTYSGTCSNVQLIKDSEASTRAVPVRGAINQQTVCQTRGARHRETDKARRRMWEGARTWDPDIW